MLRISSLFLSITAPVFKLIQDTFDGFNNYFVDTKLVVNGKANLPIIEKFLKGKQISTESILYNKDSITPGMIERNYEYLKKFRPFVIENGGQWGGMNQIHYAISKAGIIGLTRSIAKTFSNKGITCNAISPGLVKTDMTKYDLKINLGKSQIGQIPIGRIALINEIAGAASFLAGPDGTYMTGQTLN
jgi:hypothetical protein